MESHFVEFTVVVLANDHNPTILNPDFLDRNNIIERDWGWDVFGQPITTPNFSTVAYDSQVAITVEPNKFQITETSQVEISDSKVCKIVSNYLNTLSQVGYLALGINFTKLVFVDDVNEFLIARFLKEGAWNSEENSLAKLGFNFTYKIEGGSVTFSIDKGFKEEVDRPFLVVRANFHRDLDISKMPTSDKAIEYLNGVDNDWDLFNNLFEKIIEV